MEITERFNSWFERMLKYGFVENVDFTGCKIYNYKAKQKLDEYILTLDMAKEICYKNKNNKKSGEVLRQLGIDLESVHTYTRFEISFGNMLIEALKELGLEIIPQYRVNNYRIDFYIPKYNIAVEYDEEQHYTKENRIKDNIRQSHIENKLGAKFIRCDYRDSDIKNLVKVIKEVM